MLAIFVSPAQAVITISKAEINQGVVAVNGKGAGANAGISWEGDLVATANGRGAFSFTTTNLPADCVGALDDGGVPLDVVIRNCAAAHVPQTGQTTCYDPADIIPPNSIPCAGTRQDGDLLAGVVLPNPRFTDNLNGTITDNLTGLIWLKNAKCPEGDRVWQTALGDVVSLNTDGTMNSTNCGDTSNAGSHQTDWRLPNIRELHSLVNFGFSSLAISNSAGDGQGNFVNDPFINLQLLYWSSTTSAGNTLQAWIVAFDRGDVLTVGKLADQSVGIPVFVLAVRGGS